MHLPITSPISSISPRSPGELGHKWNKLARRLDGRTEHAIRNRYHRLQTTAADHQLQTATADLLTDAFLMRCI